MKITINGKIPKDKREISKYLSYNKRLNMIYTVNYNLVLNIFNIYTLILILSKYI